MLMKREESREKRWEEKLRQEKEQDSERIRRRSRILLLMIAAVILCTVVPAIVPDLLSSSVQTSDGTGQVASAAEEMPADAVPSDENTPENAAVQESSSEEAVSSLGDAVSCQEYLLPEELLFLYVNDNSISVDINVNVVFFGEDGQLLSVEEQGVWSCGPGETAIATVRLPHDAEYQPVPFERYERKLTVKETSASMLQKNYGKELLITSNIGAEGTVLAMVENPTGITFSHVRLVCLYCQGDNVVGWRANYLEDLADREAIEFYSPTDSEANPISFDSYRILVTDTAVE